MFNYVEVRENSKDISISRSHISDNPANLLGFQICSVMLGELDTSHEEYFIIKNVPNVFNDEVIEKLVKTLLKVGGCTI